MAQVWRLGLRLRQQSRAVAGDCSQITVQQTIKTKILRALQEIKKSEQGHLVPTTLVRRRDITLVPIAPSASENNSTYI